MKVSLAALLFIASSASAAPIYSYTTINAPIATLANVQQSCIDIARTELWNIDSSGAIDGYYKFFNRCAPAGAQWESGNFLYDDGIFTPEPPRQHPGWNDLGSNYLNLTCPAAPNGNTHPLYTTTNDIGDVLVNCTNVYGPTGFKYSNGVLTQELPWEVHGTDLNNLGQMIGWVGDGCIMGYAAGFLHNPNGDLTQLGDGRNCVTPMSLDDFGNIVGFWGNLPGEEAGFIASPVSAPVSALSVAFRTPEPDSLVLFLGLALAFFWKRRSRPAAQF